MTQEQHEWRRKYNRRPEVMERNRRNARKYSRRPEVRARMWKLSKNRTRRKRFALWMRDYRQTAKNKAWVREYRQRPRVKKKQLAYRRRPEIAKRLKQYSRKRMRYHIGNLSDLYVRQNFAHGIMSSRDIPGELIELKRAQLMLTRRLKQLHRRTI